MDAISEVHLGPLGHIPYGVFLLTFAFGVAVRLGWITNRRFRFVHHALFFLLVAGHLALALLLLPYYALAIWPALIALLLLGMPFFRGRSRGHTAYACFCLAAYTGILIALQPLVLWAIGVLGPGSLGPSFPF